MSEATNYAWLRWLIIGGDQSTGRAGSRLSSNIRFSGALANSDSWEAEVRLARLI